MKRIAMLLTVALLLALCGCGAKKTEAPAAEQPAQSAETSDAVPGGALETPPDAGAETVEPQETDPVDETDWTAQYAPVLDAICDVVYNGFHDENEYPLVPSGIIELSNWSSGPDAAEEIGYCFADLNGDGAKELLVAEDGSLVIGGYAIVNGEPQQFLDGWSRNVYALLEDGRIFNQGSGGAAYTMFSVSHLSDDGTELVCEDCYFTDADEENDYQIILYHNTTGAWDPDVSERFEGTEDDFWNKAEELAGDPALPELTALSAYDYAGPLNQPLDCPVRVDYYDDVSWKLPEGEEIGSYFPELASTGDPYEVSVVFRAAGGVEEFKLLSLSLTDVDAAGNASFTVTELCRLPELKADVPLTVPMSFPGDMPTNGFSYRADGVERQFSVSQSGRDGAIVVSEINAR